MNCPSCHSDMRVMDSRKQAGSTVRRRECSSCGHRLTTMEVVLAQRAERPAKAPKHDQGGVTVKAKVKPPKSVKIARAVRKTKQYDDFSSNGDEDYGYIDDLKETGLDLPNID